MRTKNSFIVNASKVGFKSSAIVFSTERVTVLTDLSIQTIILVKKKIPIPALNTWLRQGYIFHSYRYLFFKSILTVVLRDYLQIIFPFDWLKKGVKDLICAYPKTDLWIHSNACVLNVQKSNHFSFKLPIHCINGTLHSLSNRVDNGTD